MRHKRMQVMMERDREHPFSGWVELDDAYLGGERSGGKRGRGAPGKTHFLAAVATHEEGHPLRVKLTVVEGLRLTEVAAWAQQHLSAGTRVVSDGLACFPLIRLRISTLRNKTAPASEVIPPPPNRTTISRDSRS